MKRKILFQLFALGLLLQVTACQLQDSEGGEIAVNAGQWLVYTGTQCADPWGYCNNSQDKKVCVQDYVEKQGFTVLDINVTKEQETPVCTACQCPSGYVYKVRVSQPDVTKLLNVGFKKQQ